jgi:ribonucleoside-diphosphate reductase alpha chain
VTVYRDRSRPEQVLSPIATQPGFGATLPAAAAEPVSTAGRIVSKRPLALRGVTEKIKTGYGNLYVTVNYKDNRPFEVFAHIGKSGYTTMADTEAICRMISLTLRAGVGVTQVIRQLRGIGGSNPVFSEGAKISSIPDAIAQVLERQITPSQQALELAASEGEEVSLQPSEICPSCSSPMIFDSGCYCCRSCGYSTC